MISTAAAPSVICDEFAAVITPSGLNAGLSLASFSIVGVGTDAFVLGHRLFAVVGRDRDRQDLPVEAALFGGPGRAQVRLDRERVVRPRG